ncbi:MAG: NAD-binding protein, partial [Burkholderiaceae bacterium]|nr:NAD-binding protein [Burkholderiaceae bacterium]
ETEFRHQVESSIRPFRDVLLGLFFIGIGMLFEPAAIPRIWHWALLGALLLLVSKILLVAAMVKKSGIDTLPAWRTALLLSVGGEFGFALLAIALDARVVDPEVGQIALTAVLFSMIAGAFLIRFNHALATRLVSARHDADQGIAHDSPGAPEPQVIVGGYGRVGHTIAVLLKASSVPYVAFDIDPKRVAQGRADGHPVLYGDISDAELLAAAHVERTALVVITVDDHANALRAVAVLRSSCPHVPVIARARDLESSAQLIDAGATHAYPEAIEASLRLGATALRMLSIPTHDIDSMLQDVRDWDYKPLLEEEPAQERNP